MKKKTKLDSIAITDMFYTKTCKPVLKKGKILQKIYFLFLSQ